MQIFPVKIRGGGIDECHSLDVHSQAQHWFAVSSEAVLSAGQDRAGQASRGQQQGSAVPLPVRGNGSVARREPQPGHGWRAMMESRVEMQPP